MTVHDALFERVRRANPVASSQSVDTITLRRLVDDRIGSPRRLARGPLIAVVIAVALFAVVIPLVLVNDDPGPVVTETTLPAPTTTPTTLPATTTTTARPTTTTSAVPPPPFTISWTRIDDPVFSDPGFFLTGIAATKDGLIATGLVELSDEDWDAVILVTLDGQTWSRVEDPSLAGPRIQNALSVATRGDLAVVAGLSDLPEGGMAPRIWRSEDAGASWESIPIEGDGLMYTVLATDDLFIAAGYGIWVSEDGSAWRQVSDEDIIRDLAETPRGFVAVGQRFSPSAATVWISPDGENWERARSEGDALAQGEGNVAWLWAAATDGDTTTAVGTRGAGVNFDPFNATVWRSIDDATWERLPRDPVVFGGGTRVGMTGVVSVDGAWVAAGGRADAEYRFSEGRVWVSEDGITWFRLGNTNDVLGRYGGGYSSIENLIWDGERLIAVGTYFETGGAVWLGTIER